MTPIIINIIAVIGIFVVIALIARDDTQDCNCDRCREIEDENV